ncbi:sugar ABC transporter ATP-binding protein [Tessaracoccus flavus]|uniref:Uncharacterized protein n=1 Tax=Tessaracoccus flavus TaxID=1610493 RepID=A0A1Q2CHJ6_9ACTN|nr:sugar ABC transporter ATP-binding protein [Tessaracoccus flavus]AQP45581.1 hypothetical protein RPIT_12835 [Tessaracoccus flavus]SDY78284.1 monosaccharide ABC transporter ATP-binding protein, CUT2 family [Tessaracoccus flavus]
MIDPDEVVLECEGLSKSYGRVRALDAVSLTLHKGEVRALLGKNGAGKSTLVKLLSGVEQPDKGAGEIRLAGQPVAWSSALAAQHGGITVVHQEFSLVPELSIAENITLGHWPSRGGLIDKAEIRRRASEAMAMLGVDLPLSRPVSRLSTAQQQLVEISKALSVQPKVLILDEPTSALNSNEVEVLLALLRRLASQGVSIIYVSHRMREIPQVADTLTVLRDGREVATRKVSDISAAEVARMIAGTDERARETVAKERLDEQTVSDEVVLAVEGLSIPGILENVNFELRRGEVLGFAGLLGSGRTELLEAIFGQRSDATGTVAVLGRQMTSRRPGKMLDAGVGMTTEDRKKTGIVPILSVSENMMLSARSRVVGGPLLDIAGERAASRSLVQKLRIQTSGLKQPIGTLSGGNQQKAVIGRCLAGNMKVLLLDEPTRGVDVDAKRQIYDLIRELADAGVSSVFVSSELEELSQVCDRVLVLRDGGVREELPGAEATSERLLALAMIGKEGHLA